MNALTAGTTGTQLPSRRHRIDQTMIDWYAELSGDRNPLHVDPAFAATTPYGRCIAHGMMTLALISDAMRGWAGPAWCTSGALDIRFLAPVFSGNEIIIGGACVGSAAGRMTCTITCTSEERTVAAGEASVVLTVHQQ